MNEHLLKSLGFSDKAAAVYLTLLQLGPSSVRTIALKSGLNRGSTYDALTWLKEHGIVDFFKKDSKQQFVAEDPARLSNLLVAKREELHEAEIGMKKMVTELQALHNKGGERPLARYFAGRELRHILEDVLTTCEQDTEPMYRMYSAAGVREYLYRDFPTFSDVRVGKGVAVKVIASGGGGELRGLDERKHLDLPQQTPTCILIFPGKTAYVSLDAKGEPVGVVIENAGVYETQRAIFDSLWKTL